MTHTEMFLERQPEGPPSPVALEQLAIALLWDGKIEAAQALVDRMIDAYVGRSEHGRSEHERFHWWLGFGYAVDAVAGRAKALSDRRAARRYR